LPLPSFLRCLCLKVRCNSSGAYLLASSADAPYNDQLAESSAVWEGTVAHVNVAGAPMPMRPPAALPARPRYLPDLTSLPGPVPPECALTLDFETEGGPFVPGDMPVSHINGAAFVSKDSFLANLTLGQVVEWTAGIAGDSSMGAGNHPFHVHVNPFQVVAIGGSAYAPSTLGVAVGEYRDTVPLWRSASYTLRFRPDSFVGRALIHCHMIPHVDLGMAAVVNIVAAAASANASVHVD